MYLWDPTMKSDIILMIVVTHIFPSNIAWVFNDLVVTNSDTPRLESLISMTSQDHEHVWSPVTKTWVSYRSDYFSLSYWFPYYFIRLITLKWRSKRYYLLAKLLRTGQWNMTITYVEEKQWATVRTYRALMRQPPHKVLLFISSRACIREHRIRCSAEFGLDN